MRALPHGPTPAHSEARRAPAQPGAPLWIVGGLARRQRARLQPPSKRRFSRAFNQVLPRLPLFRLRPLDTIGEAGALHGARAPPGVTISTCGAGARLLCWPSGSSLAETLSRLPELLPGSWRSRAHLSFLLETPSLTRQLIRAGAIRKVDPAELEQRTKAAGSDARNSLAHTLCLVSSGTIHEHLPVQVKLTPCGPMSASSSGDGAGGGFPHCGTPPHSAHTAAGLNDSQPLHAKIPVGASWSRAPRRFELQVRVHSRHRLLADLTSIIHDLGLEVHSARIATEVDERGVELANDIFSVVPRGITASLDTATLTRRIISQLVELLTVHPLLTGDCAVLSDLSDGHHLSVPQRQDEPAASFLVDIVAAAAVFATQPATLPRAPTDPADSAISSPSPHGDGPGAPGSVGELLRTMLGARHPHLAAAIAEGAGDVHAAAAFREAAGGRVGGPAHDWLRALSELCLYLQREAAGQSEEGMALEDLALEMTLGEGASGIVRLARHRFSGRLYAAKIFSKARLCRGSGGRALLRYIEREREVLQLLSTKLRGDKASAHMVRYVCSGQDAPSLRLVMPACLGGELWSVLAEFGAMSEREARFYAGCLTLALQKLHSIGVVYRDLKPENVLLSASGWPVIADFGLATLGSLEERPLYSMCGTPEFMAPEVVRSLGYGPSADWWSLGVLIAQCLTLATPFADPQGRAQMTFSNILRRRVTAERSQDYRLVCSPHAVALIDSLLQPEPAKRLGDSRRDSGRIRIHPFFWGLDWQALEARKLAPPHADYCALAAEKLLASPPSAQPAAAEKPEGPPLTPEQQQLFAHW